MEKKKGLSIEQIKQNTIKAHEEMVWLDRQLLAQSRGELYYSIFSTISKQRKTSIFLTGHTYETCITNSILNSEYEMTDYYNKYTKDGGVATQSLQYVVHIAGLMVSQPTLFAFCIDEYFAKKTDPKDLIIFAHCTFPSLFSFFVMPDIANYASALCKSLLCYDNMEVSSHFISAFFENSPSFLSTLFDTYNDKLISKGADVSPMVHYHYFIQSLEIATSCLTINHVQIADSVFNISENFFNRTFSEKLFLPQIKSRNPSSALIQIFHFIIANEKSAPFTVFAKTLMNKSSYKHDIVDIFGGIDSFGFTNYPFLTSGYEIRIFLNLTDNDKKNLSNKLAFSHIKPESLNVFASFMIMLYPNKMQSAKPPKFQIFPPFKRAIFKSINEDYLRCYNSIRDFANQRKIDPIYFYLPDTKIPSSFRIDVKNVVSRMKWDNISDFHKFAFSQLANEYADKAKTFDIILSLKCCLVYFDNLNDAIDSIFLSQLIIYKNNKKLKNNDVVLFRDLRQLNEFQESQIHDVTSEFKEVYEMYSDVVSLPRIEYIKNLKQIINNILGMSFSIRIRLLPRYIIQVYQIACSLSKDPIEQQKIMFKSIFEIVSDWKRFYDTFYIYFNHLDNKVNENDLFARMIKKPWDLFRTCLENTVFEESPIVESFFNNSI